MTKGKIYILCWILDFLYSLQTCQVFIRYYKYFIYFTCRFYYLMISFKNISRNLASVLRVTLWLTIFYLHETRFNSILEVHTSLKELNGILTTFPGISWKLTQFTLDCWHERGKILLLIHDVMICIWITRLGYQQRKLTNVKRHKLKRNQRRVVFLFP